MGEHREKYTIFGPFPDVDPLDTARLFLRTNRYNLSNEKLGAPPAELEVDRALNDADADSDASEIAENDESTPEATDSAGDEELSEASDGESGDDPSDASEDEVDELDEASDDEPDDDSEAEEASEPVELPDEVVLAVSGQRGERWAGLTSSNMADLETTVNLKLLGNSIQVDYVVNTTGQFLNDDERAYWLREAKAMEAFVTGGDLVNVISDESARASRARGDLLRQGLWIAAIVFVVVFISAAIYLRM